MFDDATLLERRLALLVPTVVGTIAILAQPSTARRLDPLFIGGVLLASGALELGPSVLVRGLVSCRAILWSAVSALVALTVATVIAVERDEEHSMAGLIYLAIPAYGFLLALTAGFLDWAFHRVAKQARPS